MNIYVGNLHYHLEEGDLKSAFESYGEVVSAKIITDRETGRSKGFGFVEMENEAEAREAMENLNGTDLKGRNLIVNQARERQNDGGGGRRGGGGGFRRNQY